MPCFIFECHVKFKYMFSNLASMLFNINSLLTCNICVTSDQQFMFCHPVKSEDGNFKLNIYKRLVGYNGEILDMRFLGDEEQYPAVTINLEQVHLNFHLQINSLMLF